MVNTLFPVACKAGPHFRLRLAWMAENCSSPVKETEAWFRHGSGQTCGGGMDDKNDLALDDRQFARIRAKVRAAAGISLSENKRTLVETRLMRLVQALGLRSFSAYLDHLDRPGSDADRQNFVNALTTNLTRFFREDHHFEHLVAHVGGLLAQPPRRSGGGRPRLRIWSAGCSTGQEPYTIAASLFAAYPALADWDFRILATDIDTTVIERAALGEYSAAETGELTARQAKLFPPVTDGVLRMPEQLRRTITFKPLNLLAPWPIRGPFDAVFCRNVAIYFDRQIQHALFARFCNVLAVGGCLYLGHSENLGSVAGDFRPVGKNVYQKAPAERQSAA